jgi:hypothetical protein
MIDVDSIEDVEDCDGESVLAYGPDSDTGEWRWDWVSIEHLHDYGRTDIIRQFFPAHGE